MSFVYFMQQVVAKKSESAGAENDPKHANHFCNLKVPAEQNWIDIPSEIPTELKQALGKLNQGNGKSD